MFPARVPIVSQPPSTTASLSSLSTSFVSTWDTTGSDETVTLPFVSSGSIDFTIEWGDGNTDTVTAYDDDLGEGAIDHVYSSAATYTIAIGGTIRGFKFNNGGDKAKIKTITQWGTFDISTPNAFHGCNALDISATDAPTISSTNLADTFSGCTVLSTNIGSLWDVSSVTNMSDMFASAINFNGDIGDWNTGAVIYMVSMFHTATIFNQDIGGWDTSNVTSFVRTFQAARAFNQDISDWDTSSATNMSYMFFQAVDFNQDLPTDGNKWDVSNVTKFTLMFYEAVDFNGNISSWVTSSLTRTDAMFSDATSFDQDLSAWTVSGLTIMTNMFQGSNALSDANWSAFLIRLEATNSQSSVSLHGGDANATVAGAAARLSLENDHSWTIVDGDG